MGVSFGKEEMWRGCSNGSGSMRHVDCDSPLLDNYSMWALHEGAKLIPVPLLAPCVPEGRMARFPAVSRFIVDLNSKPRALKIPNLSRLRQQTLWTIPIWPSLPVPTQPVPVYPRGSWNQWFADTVDGLYSHWLLGFVLSVVLLTHGCLFPALAFCTTRGSSSHL
jgi:hypothetical protein